MFDAPRKGPSTWCSKPGRKNGCERLFVQRAPARPDHRFDGHHARIASKACSAYALRREWRAVVRAVDDRMLRDIGLGRSGDRIRNRQQSRECIALARISRHECQTLFDRGEPRWAEGQWRPPRPRARSRQLGTVRNLRLDDRLGGIDDPHRWFPDLSPAVAGLFFTPRAGPVRVAKLQRIRGAGVLVLGAMTSMTSPVRGSIRLHGDAGPCEPIIWRSRSARIRVR